jgi:hypothetical protein
MALAYTPIAGETLASIASKFLGDPGRFREIADLNAIDIFEEALSLSQIQIPTIDELLKPAAPILAGLRNVEGWIEKANEILPPEFQGYTKDALKLLGDINGALDDPISTIGDILGRAEGLLGGKDGQMYQVIDWLLTRRSPDRSKLQGALSGVLDSAASEAARIATVAVLG